MISQVGDQVVTAVVVVVVVMAVAMVRMSVAAVSSGNLFFHVFCHSYVVNLSVSIFRLPPSNASLRSGLLYDACQVI